jgi:hypothetical protein
LVPFPPVSQIFRQDSLGSRTGFHMKLSFFLPPVLGLSLPVCVDFCHLCPGVALTQAPAWLPVFKKSPEGGKPDLTDSAGFCKIWKKIGEIRENSAKMHRRRRRNSENRKDQNAVGFTDKSADFNDKLAGFARRSA